MSLSKKRTCIVRVRTLFLLLIVTICPHLSYGKNVESFDLMDPDINSNGNAGIKMVAMGIKQQGGGKYQATMLLKNGEQDGNPITFDDERYYGFELIDSNNDSHRVNITNVEYSEECANKVLSKECRVAVTGFVNSGAADTKFNSYSIKVPYNFGAVSIHEIQEFKNRMPGLEVQGSGVLSVASGSYTVNIKNISEHPINIKLIARQRECIDLDGQVSDIYLSPDEIHGIQFKFNAGADKKEFCIGVTNIGIKYEVMDGSNIGKNGLIPIKITSGGSWMPAIVGLAISVAGYFGYNAAAANDKANAANAAAAIANANAAAVRHDSNRLIDVTNRAFDSNLLNKEIYEWVSTVVRGSNNGAILVPLRLIKRVATNLRVAEGEARDSLLRLTAGAKVAAQAVNSSYYANTDLQRFQSNQSVQAVNTVYHYGNPANETDSPLPDDGRYD